MQDHSRTTQPNRLERPMRLGTRGALALGTALLAAVALIPAGTSHARTSLAPLHSAPPAGLSVEAKAAPFDKGFDFRFRSDTNATATISLDPLGFDHSDSASLSSSAGSISLNAKYDRSRREIEIKARRGGQDIGEFTWRVEASLR